ncbi:MAG: DUF3052 family protein [Bacteroidetes bacterium]|nr:MAG: DUF3052 family protein [Bacteroidota bacterium]
MAGYSARPLIKKLGIKPEFSILVFNAPKPYSEFFSEGSGELNLVEKGSRDSIDFIHIFCLTKEELVESSNLAIPFLKKNGLLWVSWPKGNSGIKTELKRDPIREYLLSRGLVDVKVAAVDETWSGLKFVYRLKDR